MSGLKLKGKLTIVFTDIYQTGLDMWSNYYKTVVIELTEDQNKLLTTGGMKIHDTIFECETDDDEPKSIGE